MGQIPERPAPTFLERFFTGAYDSNPEYAAWARGHNHAAQSDARAFDASLKSDHHDATSAHDVARLNTHWPARATPIGTDLRDPSGIDHGPIRDVNTITVDNRPWGFLYRTRDGTLFVQRDRDSLGTTSHTEGYSVGGSAGAGGDAGKGSVNLGVNGQYNASTTTNDPNEPGVVPLHNVDALPRGSLVQPLHDAQGNPLPGSRQLVPEVPHAAEETYDGKHQAPEKFEYMPASPLAANAQAPAIVTVANTRLGETSIAFGDDLAHGHAVSRT